MAFRHFICWDLDRVRDVMNTNAEIAQRDIFLAVHSEYPLTMRNPGVGDLETAPRWTSDPHQFLQEFLSPDQRHVQVAVLGNSGSGKSHFIRWMALNIPEESSRYVIAVPRVGISLRGVIDLVLAALPSEQARPYLEQLDQAGFQRATPADLQDRLISAIALAIGEDEPTSDEDQDLEAVLIEELPNLFHDPALRSHYKKAGGLVEQLVNQVLRASPDYNPVEERRTFALNDLPLTVIQPRDLSEPTRRTLDYLRADDKSQRLAVKIINRNADRAVPQMMNFTADRLGQLFADVRKHLRSQGQELVLLVEDLARLQGLDLALLNALIEEGNDENGLCTLRWAAAVTTGYYAQLANSVKTRMTFVLDMDLSREGDEPIINDGALVSFASRYLNAVRLDPDLLGRWAQEPDAERGAPPNACESCEYRQTCHEAFGSEQGIGLYPLSSAAIVNMLRRLDPRLDERFNPRLLVKDVLAEVFGTHGRDLDRGQFPSGQLLSQMGGAKLPPIVADELRRQDQDQAQRQLAILELWGDGGPAVTDLPEELYTAFGLAKPTVQGRRQPPTKVQVAEEGPKPVAVDNRLSAIRAWGNGGPMEETLASFLRPRLFEAVVSHIDWDQEGLVRSQFARATGTNANFRRNSISFQRQQTQAIPSAVTLRIPAGDGEKELSEAGMAFEGLYQFHQQGDWNFPDGSRLLEVLANCLDQWSEHVLEQLKRLPGANGEWDPAASAVEMLAVGAALGGRPAQASATLPDVFNALFEEWPQNIPAQSPEWRDLYQLVFKEQAKLRDLVLAKASGTKGGQQGAFVDPSKLLPPLRRVRRGWELAHSPPEGIANRQDDYGALARLHNRVASQLAAAAKTEWLRKTSWAEEWRKVVPEGIGRREVVDALKELLRLVTGQGIGFDNRVGAAIQSSLAELETVQLDAALRSATSLRGAEEPVKELSALGRDWGVNAITAVARFLPAANEFLNQVEASVANRLEHLDQGGKDLQEHQAQIKESLRKLSHDLGVIGGEDAGAG